MRKKQNRIFPEEWNGFNQMIAEALSEAGRNIEASDCLKQQIDCRIQKEVKKEIDNMKHINMKKIVIGVIAASLLIGTVCVAGSGLRFIKGQSSAEPQYLDFEDKEKAEAEVGYEVDAVETFDNGYEMKGITIGEQAVVDETEKVGEKKKTIYMEYKHGDDTLSYSSNAFMEGQTEESLYQEKGIDQTFEYRGKKIIFTQSRYICVKPDYVLTEEEQKAMDEGELSVGVDSVGGVEKESYFMAWVHEGKICSLFGFDLSMTPEEIFEMAKEIIDIQVSE